MCIYIPVKVVVLTRNMHLFQTKALAAACEAPSCSVGECLRVSRRTVPAAAVRRRAGRRGQREPRAVPLASRAWRILCNATRRRLGSSHAAVAVRVRLASCSAAFIHPACNITLCATFSIQFRVLLSKSGFWRAGDFKIQNTPRNARRKCVEAPGPLPAAACASCRHQHPAKLATATSALVRYALLVSFSNTPSAPDTHSPTHTHPSATMIHGTIRHANELPTAASASKDPLYVCSHTTHTHTHT